MKFSQFGFPCVALMGWTVSPQQADIIRPIAKGAVLLVDADKQKEAQQYASVLATRLWTKMPDYPASDPEALTEAEVRSLA
jgi:hypothetical protein